MSIDLCMICAYYKANGLQISCDNFALGHIWKIMPDYNDNLGNYIVLLLISIGMAHQKAKNKKCGNALSRYTLTSELTIRVAMLPLLLFYLNIVTHSNSEIFDKIGDKLFQRYNAMRKYFKVNA